MCQIAVMEHLCLSTCGVALSYCAMIIEEVLSLRICMHCCPVVARCDRCLAHAGILVKMCCLAHLQASQPALDLPVCPTVK